MTTAHAAPVTSRTVLMHDPAQHRWVLRFDGADLAHFIDDDLGIRLMMLCAQDVASAKQSPKIDIVASHDQIARCQRIGMRRNPRRLIMPGSGTPH